jgi:hypothetical protein
MLSGPPREIEPRTARFEARLLLTYIIYCAIHDQAYSGSVLVRLQIAIINTMSSVQPDSQCAAHHNELQMHIISNISIGDYVQEGECEFGPNSHGSVSL